MIPTFENLDKLSDKDENKLQKDLIRIYSESLKETRGQLVLAYEKYAVDGLLDFANMQKYNRLAALEASIIEQLNKLYADISKFTIRSLSQMFITNYLYTGFIFEVAADTKLSFMMLSEEVIKKAIQNPISGLTLTQRLGKNRTEIIVKTREQLTQSLIQGESIDKMSKRIKGLYENDTVKSLRIAQTETTRVRNEGKEKGYEKAQGMGVEFKKVWVATLDSKTRRNHQKLDGMYADKDGYFKVGRFKGKHPGGFGVAEMDINCRCTTRAEFKGLEPTKRKDNENKNIIDYKSYEDWKKDRVRQ